MAALLASGLGCGHTNSRLGAGRAQLSPAQLCEASGDPARPLWSSPLSLPPSAHQGQDSSAHTLGTPTTSQLTTVAFLENNFAG